MRTLSLCTLALCLGFASITHASTVTRVKIKGNTAGGGTSTVEDPCFNGYLSVTASEQVTRDSTSTSETKELLLSFFGSDSCKSLSYSGFATVPLTVPIANQSTVTLPFDIQVDVTPFDSEVSTQKKRLVGSATITATGDFVKTRQTNILQNEATRQVVRSKGNSREADIAVSAKLGGAQLNFVLGEGFAEIGTTKNGTIEITRY